MRKYGILKLVLICWLLCVYKAVWAQTYSPVFIFNSSDVETESGKYEDHSPGSAMGLGMIVYWPALDWLDYRASFALQNRKFHLTYNDTIERRYSASSLDVGGGVSSEFLDMIGIFAAVEVTAFLNMECKGGSPCTESGGEPLAGQLQAGFSLGPKWLKFEPYWEHMPFAPLTGAKSLTTYGLAIHFFPESFEPN